MKEKEFLKELYPRVHELVVYSVNGECGGRTADDCKKELEEFLERSIIIN